ncbi:T9SS type A sorting domain-containing protein [Hymenobacter antarcticus]|uniref:Secretion system C-terminal sorting domain-containing protein n=1 Tax=Hymenobacter antarcticus TaxID=486270 RepID=A0ABP7QXV7_9BACT
MYQPGTVTQAQRQPDGQTLLLGPFQRVASQASSQLVRLLAGSTQPDPAFQTNVAGLQGQIDRMALLPNGKILLLDNVYYGIPTGSGVITLGSVSRQALLLLNADGTPDAGFDAGLSVFASVRQALPQPDGKILLVGRFPATITQAGPCLIRLNADGSRDTSFQAVGFADNTASYSLPFFVALQPDGKLLVTGPFAAADGQPQQGVARLLPTGALDPTFQSALPPNTDVFTVMVQPDGNLLLTCAGALSTPNVIRLLATGSIDPTFQLGARFNYGFSASAIIAPVVQPDGRILIATRATALGSTPTGRVVRLLPTGALDPNFDNGRAAAGKPNSNASTWYPGSVQLLPNGQVLVAAGRLPAELFRYAPLATELPVGVVLLNADGSRDASFAPLVQEDGRVNDMALQPDGKLLVGGSFSEINGTPVRNLARLQPNGLVDASFAAVADAQVLALALQPDGRLAVGGDFDYLNGVARPALGRVLSTGAADASFVPPIAPAPTNGTGALPTSIQRLALDPATGGVLAAGDFRVQQGSTTRAAVLARFAGATGQVDASFQSTAPPNGFQIQDMVPQANGALLLAGQLPVGATLSAPIWRLLPTGALDPGFTLTTSSFGELALAVAQDSQGRLYLTGNFENLGAPGNHYMARLLANGSPDPSFQVVLPGSSPLANTVVVQPNGRVLLGGTLPSGAFNSEGTLRLLPTGALDTSYNPSAGPMGGGGRNGYVRRLLLQPNGAILAAGAFPQVGTLPINALVRLTDAHVLAIGHQQAAARLAAWPIPAHEVLHLSLDAASRPQRVELFDALGRVVLTQPVSNSELSLNTAALPAGVYLLRVRYAQAVPGTRRVVVE